MYTIPVRFVSTYDYFLEVCVQFPTSADNVTLLASAADRRAAVLLRRRCCRSSTGAIDRYRLHARTAPGAKTPQNG